MGVVKHFVPKSVRSSLVERVDHALPEGLLRNNLANIETGAGVGLVVAGSMIDGKTGLVMRALGELLDDIDGDTARALEIDSRFGAIADTVADKIKVAFELRTLWQHTEDFERREQLKRRAALGTIATKHGVNMAINVTAFILGQAPTSSDVGKVNMWTDGIALASFGISDVAENPRHRDGFADLGYLATAVGVPIGVATAYGYAKNLVEGLSS